MATARRRVLSSSVDDRLLDAACQVRSIPDCSEHKPREIGTAEFRRSCSYSEGVIQSVVSLSSKLLLLLLQNVTAWAFILIEALRDYFFYTRRMAVGRVDTLES
jgi:hypothetical protein